MRKFYLLLCFLVIGLLLGGCVGDDNQPNKDLLLDSLFTFEENESGYTITKYIGSLDEVNIPSEYQWLLYFTT